jgi:hypothetical protein
MAVRGGAAGEVVTLHRAREALADRRAGDVDHLAGLEDLGGEFGAGRKVRAFVRGEAELDQRLAGSHARFRVMAGQRLAQQLRAARAVRHLHGAVTVGALVLDLRDAIGQNLDDGDGHGFTVLREHSRHAALAADQTHRHRSIPRSAAMRNRTAAGCYGG